MASHAFFLSNLRYWAFHVSLNAAPSFIIACSMTNGSLGPRIAGMVPVVLCFIFGYAVFTSSSWFRRKVGDGHFAKALRWATRIRSGIAGVGIIGSIAWIPGVNLPAVGNLALLELYAGILATAVVNTFGNINGVRDLRIFFTGDVPEERAQSVWLGDMDSIIPTFLTTVTEGILLSILMFALAGIIFAMLKLKAKRGRS